MKLYSPKKNNRIVKRNHLKSAAFQSPEKAIVNAGIRANRRVLPKKVSDNPCRRSFTKLLSKRFADLSKRFQKTVEELIKEDDIS